jgi:glycosyltransferase involved in cell wall biosynthesis
MEFLKTLAEKHRVTFVGTFDPLEDSVQNIRKHLSAYCERLELIPTPYSTGEWGWRHKLRDMVIYPPARLTRFLCIEYVQKVQQLWQDHFDLLICNTILAGQVSRSLNKRNACRKILDVIDIFELMRRREYDTEPSHRLTKLWKYVDWRKTAFYEQQIWGRFDAFIAISEPDAEAIKQTCVGKPVAIIPTGISLAHQNVHDYPNKDLDLLFVGKLDYPANVEALGYFDENIMPVLVKSLPQIKIGIVGKNPAPKVEQIVSRLGNYALFRNVADTSEYYGRAKVVAIPIRNGSGIKVKLLEALANGVPIVTTSVGAYGVPVKNNQQVFVADDPIEFAQKVMGLLHDPERADALGARGRDWVSEQFDWNRVKPKYADFVESVSSI